MMADRINGQRHATVDGQFVEPHRTTGTGSAIATDFGASHVQLDPQGIGQRSARFNLQSALFAVDVQRD